MAANCNKVPKLDSLLPPLSMLPLDMVLTEIFTRLPAKSLMRFKCVSKFFRTHISSKQFIDLHLSQTRSSNTNTLLILDHKTHQGLTTALYSIDLDDNPNTGHITELCYPKLNSTDGLTKQDITFVGCCNGLICVVRHIKYYDYRYADDEELVILNPSTGLHTGGIPIQPAARKALIQVSFGFGYDSINDDYKFVGYYEYLDTDLADSFHFVFELMISSVRAASWRCVQKISKTHYALHHCVADSGVLVNNKLVHWMFCCSTININDGSYRLGCFDLETEQWTADLPLPPFEYYLNGMRSMNGCLALFTSDNCCNRYIWVMKEYGVRESWVKLISLPRPEYTKQLEVESRLNKKSAISAYRKEARRDEILIRVQDEGYCWYNVGDGTYTPIRLQGITISHDCKVLTSTFASLVDLELFKGLRHN